jgi:uncharacterized membrane protein YbhN (UPF0104 family)
MLVRLSHKTKQFFFVLIKLSVVVAAFYIISHKLTSNDALEISSFLKVLQENELFSIENVFLLLLLTVFNWFFEILKWQLLLKPISPISFKIAAAQSLGALTASLLTPNRLGEYAAKVMYFKKPKRKAVVLLNLLGHLLQMSVTVIFGVIGLWLFQSRQDLGIDYIKISLVIFVIVGLIILVLFLLNKIKMRIKGYSVEKLKHFFQKLPKQTFVYVFLCSVVRYLIFSFQFFLLLKLFKVNISYFDAMTVISSVYLLASIIPSLLIFDVLIKGSVAVYLFGLIAVNGLTVLSVVTLMWLLNFMLPSVFGSYYVLNFKLPKSTA